MGRVCVKLSGREAGKYGVVVKKIDKSFVLVTGPRLLTGIKRRRCNIEHLEPTPHLLEIKEESTDREVIEAYEKAGLITKLGLKRPSEAQLKTEKPEKAEKEKKEKKPKEKEVKKPKEKKPQKK